MTDQDPPRLAVSLDWVIVDAIGAVITGLGVLGLAGGGGALHPLLDNRVAAGACIVTGIGLMGVSLAKILQRMRASAERRR